MHAVWGRAAALPTSLLVYLCAGAASHSLGHTSSLSSLQFESAFVGWDEFQMLRSGAILIANGAWLPATGG